MIAEHKARGSIRRGPPAIELMFATVAISAVGLFPKLIHGDAFALTFGRALFGSLALLALAQWRRASLKVDRKDYGPFLLISIFGAVNWAGYFAAIKVAGVSVAVVSLFTFPLLAAILEPWVQRERHDRFELFAGLAVVVGVFFVVPEFNIHNRTTDGVLLGTLAALCFTLRNVFGRRLVQEYGAVNCMTWQFLAATLMFTPFGVPWILRWTALDWLLLFVIGAVLTASSQTIFFANLRRVSASYASLLTSAQPVITVAMAMVWLGEKPTLRTLIGGAIVTASVVAVAIRKRPAAPTWDTGEITT